ncbi:MAG: thiamine phosphate synthase [Edaphobacter sp.]
MLRYAITDRALYPGGEREKQAALLRQAAHWAADGIGLIQLREKDLPASDIAALACEILKIIAAVSASTKLLINSRADIALATGAHGVHLTSAPEELTPTQVRTLYARINLPAPIVTVSCHSLDEVQRAREDHADAILFGPVFEKKVDGRTVNRGQGLDELRAACMAASPVPVYALGGVTLTNASACIDGGAAGIAGIRLFHNFVR